MASELNRRDFVKVINEIEKYESLWEKSEIKINSQTRDIDDKKREIEVLTERIVKVKKDFNDRNKRQIWLRLTRQRAGVKRNLNKLLVKNECEKQENTSLKIKISELISEKNRLQVIIEENGD